MPTPEQVQSAVLEAVLEFNSERSEDQRIDPGLDTVLLGEGASLDSLGLVNLMVQVEQKLEEDFGTSVTLASEKAFSRANSPFRTLRSMSEFADSLLRDANG